MAAQSSRRKPPAAPGDRVGDYEILAELGRGGMGLVFRARDHRLGREVALKCPWPDRLANPGALERFLREGQVAARLSHPNIVPLFEVFEERKLPWLVMQLVDGATLRDILNQETALDPVRALRYMEEVTAALQAAHTRNVLHRDINPNNVMITATDHALLTDFGLARLIEQEEASPEDVTSALSLTTEGAVMGTLHYMSPEQAVGRKLDRRSDIFSLGAVLYEMVSGRQPFTGAERGDVIEAVIRRDPPPMAEGGRPAPADLERLVRKCLAKDAAERYQDTRDLLADIRSLRKKLEFHEYSETYERVQEPRRRPRWLLPAAGAVVVVIALGVLGRAILMRGAAPVPPGSPLQVTSTEVWEGRPAVSPDGSRIAYVSEIDGNRDVYVVNATGGEPIQLTGNPAVDDDPAWFPDGTALLFTSQRTGSTAVWRMGQFGEGQTLLVDNAAGPAISPDGSRLAFERDAETGLRRIAVARMADPDDWRFVTDDLPGQDDHFDAAWSPDGKRIAFTTERDIWSVPVEGGEPRRLTRDIAYVDHCAWGPDGRFVYFSGYLDLNRALWRVSTRGGSVQRITMSTGNESHPTLSRDGKRLAYSTEQTNHDIVIRNLETGEESRLQELREDWMPVLSRNGDRVVFISERGGSTLNLWAQDLRDGAPAPGKPRRLTRLPAEVSYPTLSPDGAWLAFYAIEADSQGTERRNLWTMALRDGGGQPQRLTSGTEDDLHPDWSPDGRHLAFARMEGDRTHIWVASVDNGRLAGDPRRVTHDDRADFNPAWSPDGSMIAFVRGQSGTRDVWVTAAGGDEPARRITRTVRARRVRWYDGDALLVSGEWENGRLEVRRVPLAESEPETFVAWLGPLTPYAGFDISSDGRVLVSTRAELRGDIWILAAEEGAY